MEHKNTHIVEACANLVTQFKEQPHFVAMLESVIQQVQELEDVLWSILNSRAFLIAADDRVDLVGSIVGEAREGRNDLDYKTALRGRMILNYSCGTIEQIISLIRNVAGDVRIEVKELFPAAFTAEILDPIDPLFVNPAKIAGIMNSGRPAAVYGVLLFGVDDSFRYDIGPGYDIGHWGGGLT